MPLKVVQEILGHSQIGITADLYTHLLDEMQRDAAERMGRFFDEGEPPSEARKEA